MFMIMLCISIVLGPRPTRRPVAFSDAPCAQIEYRNAGRVRRARDMQIMFKQFNLSKQWFLVKTWVIAPRIHKHIQRIILQRTIL